MKRKFLTSAVAVAAALISLFSSCVGELERQFPWEGSAIDTSSHGPAADTTARNLIVLDFTATWCVNCPNMANAIAELADTDSSVNLIPISVHYADEMSCDASNFLVEKFSVSSFPVALFSFNSSLRTSTPSSEILKALAGQSLSGTPEGCAISAEVDVENGVFNIEATVDYSSDGIYSIGAALLEDGIVAPQIGSGEGYVHDNVLRAFLQKDYNGDSLGMKCIGDSDRVKFNFTPQPGWNTDSMKVVVYVISDGNPASVCTAGTFRLL